ncbi:MAG TPA: hypothetical protein VIL36_09335 [Acidimicrobiales bacterium]
MDVALGFATHSGWAVAVAAGLDGDGGLRVVERRRVELTDPHLPRQPYHAAHDRSRADGERLVAEVVASIADRSSAVLDTLAAAVGDAHTVAAVGVVGEERPIPDLATVLASHPLMHSTEGEIYRRGLADAAAERDLPVVRTGIRALVDRVGEALGWSPDRLAGEQARARAAIGPPWQKDHKDATAAALIALSTQP